MIHTICKRRDQLYYFTVRLCSFLLRNIIPRELQLVAALRQSPLHGQPFYRNYALQHSKINEDYDKHTLETPGRNIKKPLGLEKKFYRKALYDGPRCEICETYVAKAQSS